MTIVQAITDTAPATRSVVVVKNSYTKGMTVDPSMIHIVDISENYLPEDVISDPELLKNKQLSTDLSKNAYITLSMIQENTNQKKESLTSLRLNPEEALCWDMKIGEAVQVVFISKEGISTTFGEVHIRGIFEESMGDKSFVLVSGDKHTIMKIVRGRNIGRLELVKLVL